MLLTCATGNLSFNERDKWHRREFSSFERLNLDVQLANWSQLLKRCDSTIHMIYLYPVDSAIGFPTTYPPDPSCSKV